MRPRTATSRGERKEERMLEAYLNFQFGERKEHSGFFGSDVGLNGEYRVDDYANNVQIAYSSRFTGTVVIGIKRRWILNPKIIVDGTETGKIYSRHFRLRSPEWKTAYEFENGMYYLIIESGPEKSLSLKPSDWKKAFKKEFCITVKSDDEFVGSISGPAWTLQNDRRLKIKIANEKNLIPLFVLTFLNLSETNIQHSGDGG